MRLSSPRLIVLMSLAAIMLAVMACGSNGDSSTPGDLPLCSPGQPLSFPYIFAGEFTVNGEPGPAEMPIFARLGDCRGPYNNTPREGQYTNISISPETTSDDGGEITFHLGAPDGNTVQAEQTYTFNTSAQPQLLTLDLDFPRLP